MKSNQEKLIKLGQNINENWLSKQIAYCVEKIRKNSVRFQDHFPSASATNGIYRLKDNDDWTNGFWTGMLWMAFEWTGETLFQEQANRNVMSFQERLDQHVVLDHHDLGFLYSLSAGAGYKIEHSALAKQELVAAADVLISRFQKKGNFIQAWGKLGDPKEYRLIIDSLINLPLLFTASDITGNPQYRAIAERHYQTILKTVIKEDGTTFHTYFFNPLSGEKEYGATHQGHGDESIWARGQSWAVLGLPLVEKRMAQHQAIAYSKIVDVFLDHLPADLVPYWDFDFDDQHPAEKDSSALAIAACGLLVADQLEMYPNAKELAKGMVYQLGTHYSSQSLPNNEGLLLHGVYAHAEGKGIDEPNLWGDYFYLEALMRLANKDWQGYW
jgi:unsaturated chondroitin disaccharide hydrolase